MKENTNLPFTLTIYQADCCGNAKNTKYPIVVNPPDIDTLIKAISHDHTFISFKDNQRSIMNYIGADVITADCDNDHSDNEEDWFTAEDIFNKYPGVKLIITTSRHHMQWKDGKSPRPRYHIVFYVGHTLSSVTEYTALIQRIQADFPIYDTNAMDGARFFFGNPDTEVFIQDGTLTIVDYLHMLESEEEAFANMDEEIHEGTRNKTMYRKAVCLLKRYGDTEEMTIKYYAEAEKCIPRLEDEELYTILSSARKYYKTAITTNPSYISPEEYNETKEPQWEVPIPFDNIEVPDFPIDALPSDVGDYVVALSEQNQTPVDMTATISLAVLSVSNQGKAQVQPKPGWKENTNIYCDVILPPSERKSASLSGGTYPIDNYEAEENMKNAYAIEQSKTRLRVLEKRQKTIEDMVAKGKAEMSELDKIAKEITDFHEVKPLRLYTDDITTEKIASVLAENDGRAAIISSEGGIFDILSGIYTKNVNIDVILKGYSGDALRVDRIGRNSITVMNPTLTLMLMVQPSVLSGLMANNTFRGRGLTARFLYCMPKSNVGRRKYYSTPVPEDVAKRYEAVIRNMLEDEYPETPEIITLSPEADAALASFADELEPKLTNEYADISDWVGKLVGNTARIAALLCRASVYRSHDFLDEPEPLVISGEIMNNAIRIGRYYLEHAKAAFSLMGADNVVKQCKYVLNAVTSARLTEFTRRDIMRLCRSLKKVEDVQPVLDHLAEYGYIALKDSDTYSGKGRRPASIYLVNPYLYQGKD